MLKRLTVLAALLVSTTSPALAQQPGTVLVAGIADAESGAALEQAIVRLPDFAYLARTDGMGRATVRGIPEGKWPVEVRRLGYRPMRVVLAFTGRDTLEAVLMLEKSVASLDTVQVVAEALPAYLKEFDRRKQQGIGRFRVRSQLMLEHANRPLADVIPWLFPGLRVERMGTSAQVVSARGGRVSSRRGAVSCAVVAWLDGMELAEGDIGWLTVNDLAAVEFFSGASGPVQYRRGSECGVLILWTFW
jgi:hypothetical protein